MRIFRFVILAWLTIATLPANANDMSPPPVKGAIQHKVGPTDTLGTMSRLYGVSPEVLRQHNGGRRPDPGEVIWIPPSPHGWVHHTVTQGQTVQTIATGYGIPIQQLLEANSLANNNIAPGTVLVLPRTRMPEWSTPPASARVSAQTNADRPRRGIEASRSGRPFQRPPEIRPTDHTPHSKWVEVALPNGQRGWVRSESLVFRSVAPSPARRPTTMSFGQKLNTGQKDAVLHMVAKLEEDGFSVNPDDIINFMALETGGTFSPSARSKYSGAVGLAQFTDIAIQDMNQRRDATDQLSKDRLANMSFEEQSLVVAEYLSNAFARKKMQGKTITAADLYSAIFAPRAIGEPMHATVYSKSEDGGAFHRNKSLDTDGDGRISKAELVTRLTEWERRGEALRG
jgi:LysM repeat protein